MVDLDPIVACEKTSFGWRGLTDKGDVVNVRSDEVPSQYLSRPGLIETYLRHAHGAIDHLRANAFDSALAEIEKAIEIVPTTRAMFNRGIILLSLGWWAEGLEDYERRLEFLPSGYVEPRWCGEDLRGKKLALTTFDHGFGDTIMMLRYVPLLQAMGADVTIRVPIELRRLAEQVVPVIDDDADWFCPIMSLLRLLDQKPNTIPQCRGGYLKVDPALIAKWDARIPRSEKKRIGIAWSTLKQVDGDYARSAPIELFVDALRGADLFSLQGPCATEEAIARGIAVLEVDDFADCAAVMHLMDAVVSIDTAALHLAGAIGHLHVHGLLSHWASWRWLASWYPGVKFYQQEKAGDWDSVFRRLGGIHAATQAAQG